MPEIGKILLIIGGALCLVGVFCLYAPKGVNPFRWFGHLPGDIYYNNGTTVIWIPLVSMIVVSLVVRLAIWIWESIRTLF